jgi:magnesium transporter
MISVSRYEDTESEPTLVAIDAVADAVDAEAGLVWIDCEQPDPSELAALMAQLEINEFAQEDVAKAGQRTKLAHYGDHFHVAVYDCVLHESGLRAREIDIIFGAGWLLSVRQAPEDGDPGQFPVEHVRRTFELQRSQHDTAHVGLLLWAMLDAIVDRYFVVTEQVDERLDDVEEAVLADDADRGRERATRPMELFALGKALVRFRRAAVPLRDVVSEIVRREVPCIDSVAIVHFQDAADHVLRVADFVESQRDVLTSLRDAELALASNRMSLVQQRIAAWGAIFLVATLVTGVLGMNFQDAPELSWREGFLTIVAVIVALCLPMYVFFRRRKWL